MRAKRTAQTSLFHPATVDHPVAEELERASAWLDAHPELLDKVAADLGAVALATHEAVGVVVLAAGTAGEGSAHELGRGR